MKRYLTAVLLLLLAIPAAAQSVRDSVALATARWQTTPLGDGAEVSLVLTGAADIAYGSSGSSALPTTTYSNSKDVLTAEGFEVNEELWNFYTTGGGSKYGRTTRGTNYLMNEAPLSAYGSALDNISGTAIAVITRDTGEGKDINMSGAGTVDGSYLTLSEQELEVLDKLTELKGSGQIDNIVVLLNSSASVQLDFLFAAYQTGALGQTVL